MENDRPDGRTANQVRPLACSSSILHRAHGSASWTQGETKVLAAVYGPKAGTKKNENPEKASIEIIWKPKTGQIGWTNTLLISTITFHLKKQNYYFFSHCLGKVEREQVMFSDMSLLPCAINASSAALVDAGIPLKHLAVAICCSVTDSGCIMLDPTKGEEEKMKAFAYLVFPNAIVSVLPERPLQVGSEPMTNGIMTSVTQGAMSVDEYFHCLERGRAASAKLSEILRKNLGSKSTSEASKAG
ncbi:hypothetical protein Fmac_012144 [Flemingia macrophylla]|uniref:Exoribonuclease phosphorolytic domain-containing protein n=1 Tax=Flemingia macrophylla TaxID=520843 RepID=A0ABD1MQA7_9FABA